MQSLSHSTNRHIGLFLHLTSLANFPVSGRLSKNSHPCLAWEAPGDPALGNLPNHLPLRPPLCSRVLPSLHFLQQDLILECSSSELCRLAPRRFWLGSPRLLKLQLSWSVASLTRRPMPQTWGLGDCHSYPLAR